MTDAVDDTIELLQQELPLLVQRLCDAEREIEDRDQTIHRQARDLENHRLHALEFADYERPEVVFKILEHKLRGWPGARWQAFRDLIDRRLAETRP